MEGNNLKKKNIILITLGCIIGVIVLVLGVVQMINYSDNTDKRNYLDNNEILGDVTSCPPGQGYDSTTGSCVACTGNTYSPNDSLEACKTCIYDVDEKHTMCVQSCQDGYYLLNGSCTACEPGNECDGINKKACSAGYHQNLSGQDSCRECTAGYYQNLTGQASCKKCTGGYYCSTSGLSTPTGKCSDGYYCPEGSITKDAQLCPAGSYCPSGSSEPIQCPGVTYNPYPGQSNVFSCIACSGTVNEDHTKCTTKELKLSCQNTSLKAGDKTTCTLMYGTDDVTADANSIFSSSNLAVATITNNGSLESFSRGSVTISAAYTIDGETFKDHLKLEIGSDLKLECEGGNSLQVAQTKNCILYYQNNEVTPEYFTTSNSNIISVSDKKSIKGVTAGSATLSASYKINNVSVKEHLTINVSDNSNIDLVCNKTTLKLGESVVCNLKDTSNNTILEHSKFTSSNTGVVSINNSSIIAKAIGEANVTMGITINGVYITRTEKIKVLSNNDSLSLSCTPQNVFIGHESVCTLTYKADGTTAKTVNAKSIRSWENTIAKVSGNKIIGVKVGTTTITATYVNENNVELSASYLVHVKENVLTLSCGNLLKVNQTGSCTLKFNDTTLQSDEFVVEVSNEEIIEYNENNMSYKALAIGESDISVSYEYYGKEYKDTATIKVISNDVPCSLGYFMSSQTCERCKAGYYCDDGYSAKSCEDAKGKGYTSDLGAKSSSECYVKESSDTCNITTSIASKRVSIDDDKESKNSYYAVKVYVEGKGCNGLKLKYSATNDDGEKLSPKFVSNISSKSTYYFNVYPLTCDDSIATVELVEKDDNNNDKVIKKSSVTLKKSQLYEDWDIQDDGAWLAEDVYKEVNANPPTAAIGSFSADEKGVNVYYDNYSNGYYTIRAYRVGCGKPSTNTPSGEVPNEGACYKNDEGDYVWALSIPEGYTLDTSITDKEKCKGSDEVSNPACYKNQNNNYVWSNTPPSGYTLVEGVSDSKKCKKPETKPACYKNSENEYDWTETPKSGYELVPSVVDADQCKLNDASACYKNNFGDYIWGDYSENSAFELVSDIKDPKKCIRPPACYMNEDGKYVWGPYSYNSSYIIVDSITDEEKCNNVVNVPSTAAKIATIVYISIATMLTFGGVIVYYVYSKKKLSSK